MALPLWASASSWMCKDDKNHSQGCCGVMWNNSKETSCFCIQIFLTTFLLEAIKIFGEKMESIFKASDKTIKANFKRK
jgi:hypothetical protein